MKRFFHYVCMLTIGISLFSCVPPKENDTASNLLNKPVPPDYSSAITKVLQQDATRPSNWNGDKAVVVDIMRQIDLSQCPNDFSKAYVDHIHAWERAADIQQVLMLVRSDDNVKQALIDTALQKIFGSESNALADALEQEAALKQAEAESSKQIKTTFEQVESIAAGYGASLPK